MSSIFCCTGIKPYRPQQLSHETKFTSFMNWAKFPQESTVSNDLKTAVARAPFAIQLVQQVNFGRLESKRYFIPVEGVKDAFGEITEDDVVNANFQKLNTYKNQKCETHNKFFELNVYQKDPVNKHHWRANLARPAREIDLDTSGPTTSASTAPPAAHRNEWEESHDEVLSMLRHFSSAKSTEAEDFAACDQECGYCGHCDY
ncbi:Hypothetical protein R9X50_00531300 [Acrodontium crateriforme]|uniref:Uncharacterized protein n=1 Tax=Acrodontium crateriforme TaxID=150365 RepID=A0AAQ3M696_9PEZI|nr:Hypothetical protein R9X50_00531300 [Acrodontium crateriforme]